ncbi:molybdate ABC transporter substrate-binding protein [uncultured Oscillibacter sp.]|uniref:molybdate ABC transporter substrate-binding protein n=1 Tax=uncultured Oscillibacter sp. TaxID=876091 RepID=UPI0025D3684E|nr:molybdate ABC transporter substrate-binding protein [uncultured Oscillibacter sp.]
MKRLLLILSILLLTACGGSRDVELTVFAAASLQETLTEAGEIYQEDHPGIALVFSFDSSGTLKTQIEEGAVCDLFLSAGQKQMDQLDAAVAPAVDAEAPEEAGEGGLDLILSDTRVDLLENQVVLVVPEGGPAGIRSFDELCGALEAGTVLLAIGNRDVPVGQYTQSIFAYYGLDEASLAAAGTLTYGSNAKEVTAQVSEGSVDCGIVYATDAFSAGLEIVDTATEEMCGPVVYPAAVMKDTAHPDEALDFLTWLGAAGGGIPVFESAGFTGIGR